MKITNKYKAFELFISQVLPKVNKKYSGCTTFKFRENLHNSWDLFLEYLESKQIISTQNKDRWELNSSWTSNNFISDSDNLILSREEDL